MNANNAPNSTIWINTTTKQRFQKIEGKWEKIEWADPTDLSSEQKEDLIKLMVSLISQEMQVDEN